MNAVRAEGNHFAGGENENDIKTTQQDRTAGRQVRSKPYLLDREANLHESATPRVRQPLALAARVTVEFEYVGSGALKALGHRTGRRYCFGGPGARVAVDVRDRPALAAVANLREI
jgi:hypothetical protein